MLIILDMPCMSNVADVKLFFIEAILHYTENLSTELPRPEQTPIIVTRRSSDPIYKAHSILLFGSGLTGIIRQ